MNLQPSVFVAVIFNKGKEGRMQKLFFVLLALYSGAASASTEFTAAIEKVRSACGGISDQLSDMKKMAGINTAVTGVGTVAGGVALGTGIAKTQKDKAYDELIEELTKNLEAAEQTANDLEQAVIDADSAQIANLMATIKGTASDTERKEIIDKLNGLYEQSKKLGNVRTGTMAAATATNIAGAAIAGTNKIDEDFATKIGTCAGAVSALANVKMIAFVEGSATPEQVAQADKIISACGQYETVDLSSINKRATGAAVSGGIGAGLGFVGTITSAVANTDQTRAGDAQKEKNLNTVSNVLAGGTAAASLTSTIFNATQIAAIKRAATVADECEEALK